MVGCMFSMQSYARLANEPLLDDELIQVKQHEDMFDILWKPTGEVIVLPHPFPAKMPETDSYEYEKADDYIVCLIFRIKHVLKILTVTRNPAKNFVKVEWQP